MVYFTQEQAERIESALKQASGYIEAQKAEREKLISYATHKRWCDKFARGTTYKCDCGLSALLFPDLAPAPNVGKEKT